MKKHLFIGVVAFAIILTLFATNGALAAPKETFKGASKVNQPEHLKIEVCHKDGQSGNYSIVNVNINSVEDAQNVGGHGNHEGDSWEGYTYGGVDYPGRGDTSNCDEEEEEPDRHTEYQSGANCDGWWVTAQDYEDDTPVGDAYTVDSGNWSDPYELEDADSQYVNGKINEPEDCLQEEPVLSTTYWAESDCNGWIVWAQDYEDSEAVGAPYSVDSGSWSDPRVVETAISQYIDGDITEPQDCDQTDVTPTPPDQPKTTPTPPRDRNNPPPAPQTGGGWELFILAGGSLLGGAAFAIRRFKKS